jgi:hypothetical protein
LNKQHKLQPSRPYEAQIEMKLQPQRNELQNYPFARSAKNLFSVDRALTSHHKKPRKTYILSQSNFDRSSREFVLKGSDHLGRLRFNRDINQTSQTILLLITCFDLENIGI